MKKFNLLIVSSIVIVSLASCKKDYTCTCTTVDSSGGNDDVVGSFVINATQKGATDACASNETVSGNFTTTCTLQ